MLIDSCLGLTQLGFHTMSFTMWGDDVTRPPVIGWPQSLRRIGASIALIL